jgi:hypothetical protein
MMSRLIPLTALLLASTPDPCCPLRQKRRVTVASAMLQLPSRSARNALRRR